MNSTIVPPRVLCEHFFITLREPYIKCTICEFLVNLQKKGYDFAVDHLKSLHPEQTNNFCQEYRSANRDPNARAYLPRKGKKEVSYSEIDVRRKSIAQILSSQPQNNSSSSVDNAKQVDYSESNKVEGLDCIEKQEKSIPQRHSTNQDCTINAIPKRTLDFNQDEINPNLKRPAHSAEPIVNTNSRSLPFHTSSQHFSVSLLQSNPTPTISTQTIPLTPKHTPVMKTSTNNNRIDNINNQYQQPILQIPSQVVFNRFFRSSSNSTSQCMICFQYIKNLITTNNNNSSDITHHMTVNTNNNLVNTMKHLRTKHPNELNAFHLQQLNFNNQSNLITLPASTSTSTTLPRTETIKKTISIIDHSFFSDLWTNLSAEDQTILTGCVTSNRVNHHNRGEIYLLNHDDDSHWQECTTAELMELVDFDETIYQLLLRKEIRQLFQFLL